MDRSVPTLASNKVASATLTSSEPTAASPLRGSVLVLIQFDVCEEIRLDVLRNILGARTADATFKQKAPGYVRYQRPPVEETLEPLVLESGERLDGQIKYYDYGVVSLVFQLPFSGGWDTLVQLSCRWTSDTNFETWPRASSRRSWSAPLPRWSSLTTSSRASGCRKTTSSSTCARSKARPRPTTCSTSMPTGFRRSCAAR